MRDGKNFVVTVVQVIGVLLMVAGTAVGFDSGGVGDLIFGHNEAKAELLGAVLFVVGFVDVFVVTKLLLSALSDRNGKGR
jgi:hypothetical protein